MAIEYNGTSSYIQATSTPVLDVPLTLAAWFNSDILTANQAIIAIGSSTTDSSFVLLAAGAASGDPVGAQTRISGANFLATAGTYTANAWNHGAAVFSASNNRRAYRNGVAGTAETTNAPMDSTLDRVGLGIRSSTALTNYFDGEIAEAGIWNVALTGDEIASLADGISPTKIRPQSLVFYAPLVREIIDLRNGLSLTPNQTTITPHYRKYE